MTYPYLTFICTCAELKKFSETDLKAELRFQKNMLGVSRDLERGEIAKKQEVIKNVKNAVKQRISLEKNVKKIQLEMKARLRCPKKASKEKGNPKFTKDSVEKMLNYGNKYANEMKKNLDGCFSMTPESANLRLK